jgi:hypothetical protein
MRVHSGVKNASIPTENEAAVTLFDLPSASKKADSVLQNIRGGKPSNYELFRTPMHAFEALFDYSPKWFDGPVLDPSAGDGRMTAELVRRGLDYPHHLNDLRAVEVDRWRANPLLSGCTFSAEDYLTLSAQRRFAATVTNPPFTKTVAFIEKAKVETDGMVCILQSIAFMGTQKRSAYLKRDSGLRFILNLPKRPKWEFDDPSQGSSNVWDFAWFVFDQRHTGSVTVDWLLPNAQVAA